MTRPFTRGLQAAQVGRQATTHITRTYVRSRSFRNGQQLSVESWRKKKTLFLFSPRSNEVAPTTSLKKKEADPTPPSRSGGKRKKNWGHAETVGLLLCHPWHFHSRQPQLNFSQNRSKRPCFLQLYIDYCQIQQRQPTLTDSRHVLFTANLYVCL